MSFSLVSCTLRIASYQFLLSCHTHFDSIYVFFKLLIQCQSLPRRKTVVEKVENIDFVQVMEESTYNKLKSLAWPTTEKKLSSTNNYMSVFLKWNFVGQSFKSECSCNPQLDWHLISWESLSQNHPPKLPLDSRPTVFVRKWMIIVSIC